MLHCITKKTPTPHHHSHPNAKFFALLSFLIALGSASFWTIFPLILNNFLQSESVVGVYYAAIAGLLFFVSIASTVIFARFSKVKITKITLAINVLALLLMTVAQSIWHLALFDFLRAVAVSLIWISFSLLIRDFITDANLGATEGKVYLYANIAWVIGPIIGGFLAKFFGNESVFVFASVCFLVTLLVFWHQHLVVQNPHLHDRPHTETIRSITKNIVDYFREKQCIQVFLIAMGLNFWWAISFVYIPLQIDGFGLSQEIIGVVISACMLPLILLEGWVGKASDRGGLRKFFLIGFGILSGMTIIFAGLSTWPLILIGAFVLANIWAAFIEPLQETFLFKVVKKSDTTKYFGIYNTADPIANTLGPLFAAGVLALFHNNISALWLAAGVVFWGFVLVGSGVRK